MNHIFGKRKLKVVAFRLFKYTILLQNVIHRRVECLLWPVFSWMHSMVLLKLHTDNINIVLLFLYRYLSVVLKAVVNMA